MTSLYYDFSYLVSKDTSYIYMLKEIFIFEEAKQVYVFTMAFISYPIFSHDFSLISSDITLHKNIQHDRIVKKLTKGDFSNYDRL
jgi:hypothetical protein